MGESQMLSSPSCSSPIPHLRVPFPTSLKPSRFKELFLFNLLYAIGPPRRERIDSALAPMSPTMRSMRKRSSAMRSAALAASLAPSASGGDEGELSSEEEEEKSRCAALA